MRNGIILEVREVYLSDFSSIPAPAMMENMEGGVRILFNDIDELRVYQDQLSVSASKEVENEQRKITLGRLNRSIDRALLDHQLILDAIKSFSEALFAFVFNAEAHRQDKLHIYEVMIQEVGETSNSWELDKALRSATHELGILSYDHRLTFYTYAHNQVDFDYQKIKSRLVKELVMLKPSLS